MSIIEMLKTRLTGLKDTKAQLELNLQPLQATEEEIVLVERMLSLVDNETDAKQEVRDDLVEALKGLILPVEE